MVNPRRLASALASLALYAGVVVWLTWPLAPHAATHLPDTHAACRFDTLEAAWILSYESHALVTDPCRFADGNIYHPAPRSLFYATAALGALPYFAPTFLATGNPALALNVLFLGCVALTAWTLHLVTARWSGSELGGLVAGWTFLTTRWTLWEFLPTAPNYAVLQYFPLIAFLAARPSGGGRAMFALVVLQCLTELVYVAPAVVGPLVVLAFVRVARPATRAAGLRLLATVGLALLLLLPLYAVYAHVRADNPDIIAQTPWRGFGQPLTQLPWGPLGFQAPMAVPPVVFLLIAAGALSVVLRRRSPGTGLGWAHGALWVVVGLLMSLTPTVRWYGRPLELPHAFFWRMLPIFQALRNPGRLAIAGLVGLAILAGLAFAECAQRLGPRGGRLASAGLAALLVGMMYLQYARGVSLPLVRDPLPASYPLQAAITGDSPLVRILREPGGPLLELPVGPVGGVLFPFHVPAMYRSIFHWRPLLNGYGSFWPAGFRERMTLASALPDPDALAALRRETGLEMILLHTELMSPGERARWLALADHPQREDLRFAARDGDDLLFRVTPPGAGGP